MVVNGYRIAISLVVYNKVDAEDINILYENTEIIREDIKDLEELVSEIHRCEIDESKSLLVQFYTIDDFRFPTQFLLLELFEAEDIELSLETISNIENMLLDSILEKVRWVYEIKEDKYSLEQFSISKLFGKYDIDIDLTNPVNILIGANGLGKTTIIRLIEYYFNSNLADIISVPFDKIGYTYLDDIRDGDNLDLLIANEYIIDDFLPSVDSLLEKYRVQISKRGSWDLGLSRSYIPVEKELENYRVLLNTLKDNDLYRQFIYDLYKEKKWGVRISDLVNRFVSEETIRASHPVEVRYKDNYMHEDMIVNSPKEQDIVKHGHYDVQPLNWYVLYVDFVNNVNLESDRIKKSAWICEEIEWAIDPRSHIEIDGGLNHWWHPDLLSVPNARRYPHFTRTVLLCARPHLHDQVYNDIELYRRYAFADYEVNNIYNTLVPKYALSSAIDDVMDISIIEKLKKEGILNINQLIYENYFSLETILMINNQSHEYANLYFEKCEMGTECDYLVLLETYQRLKQEFENLVIDYETYVYPALIRNSFFYVDAKEFLRRDVEDFWIDTFTYLSNASEEEYKNYLDETEVDNETIRLLIEEVAYLESLNLFIKKISSNYADDKYKSAQVIKYEEVLRKYIQDKHVEVKPNGLYIKDSLVQKQDSNWLVMYNEDEVDLSVISSGERKIITLFALDVFYKKLLLLLDEPELSLSIVWQEMLLPDLIANGENKFVVATHSPYIAQAKEIQEYINYLPQRRKEVEE